MNSQRTVLDDLAMARNAQGGALDDIDKARIMHYLEQPTLAAWVAIASIVLCHQPPLALLEAVRVLDPGFVRHNFSPEIFTWFSHPGTTLVRDAIAYATH